MDAERAHGSSELDYVRLQCSSQRPAWWRPPSDPFPGHPGAGTVELQHVRVRRACPCPGSPMQPTASALHARTGCCSKRPCSSNIIAAHLGTAGGMAVCTISRRPARRKHIYMDVRSVRTSQSAIAASSSDFVPPYVHTSSPYLHPLVILQTRSSLSARATLESQNPTRPRSEHPCARPSVPSAAPRRAARTVRLHPGSPLAEQHKTLVT